MLNKIIKLVLEKIFLPFKQFFKFCVVGATGAIVDIGGLWMLVELAGVYYLTGAAISFVASVVNNYFLNKHWTFGDKNAKSLKQFIGFFAVSLIGLAINLLTMYFLVERVGFDYILSKAMALLVVVSWNFSMNKYFIFKK